MLAGEIRFIEKAPIPKDLVIINGLPDVGLVGVLASSHLVSSLDMKEVGSLESELFPPIVVLHDGLPKSPIRIFSDGKLVVIAAETAIPVSLIHAVGEAIVDWAISKNVKLVVSIGGMAIQNRQDIDQPKVFAALSSKELASKLNGFAEVLGEGYIVGAYALILKRCSELSVPAITLMSQSYYNYPDPEAAAAALTALNGILGLKVQVSDLIHKGEEIRLRAKDIMKRTQTEMARMDKSQEYDLPPMYG